MRKYAILKHPANQYKKVMLFVDEHGAYLFLYRNERDGPADADYWFEELTEAEYVCESEYHVSVGDWIAVADPEEGCQHDWIHPTRVIGRNLGKPSWNRYERFTEGRWTEVEVEKRG